jgi:ceramide glucosyltransferase
VPAWILVAILAGAVAYSLLTVMAAARYRAAQPVAPGGRPAISILKPLAGAEEGLEANLRSFFEQDYAEFEILLAVRSPDDPAIPVVEALRARYGAVPSSLIVTGEPPYANAKVYSLDRMLAAAHYDLLVMADSDVRVTPDLLATIAAEFADPRVALATCPYRAVPGRSWWSTLEAMTLNTDFLAGVLVARLLEGMKFALGPTIAARRATLAHIGGFDAVKDFLAEDFVMGKLAAKLGDRVILSAYVIEHRIGALPFIANLKHRLRWNRGTRRSRPLGYIGQIFTFPLPVALAVWAVEPHWWPLAAAAVAARAMAAWATAGWILGDRLTGTRWWLLPLADVLGCLIWIAGFFGNTILWRGRRYTLLPDGRFQPLQ